MQRIDDASNVPTLPSPLTTVSPGYFRRPSILAGDQGTIVTADFLNDVQENIVQVILDAGLALSKGTGTKLRDAIAAKIATHLAVAPTESVVGHARFATAAEALAGALGTVFLSPLRHKNAHKASIANPGYLRIPTDVADIIVNFGARVVPSATSAEDVTYAQAFGTACLAVACASDIQGVSNPIPHAGAIPHPTTPLTVIRLQTSFSGVTIRWISLGY